ncbi:class II fructose-bisphosphate aldolase [Caproiciproducens galactitolivorans]|uniref:D-tagatose-1,6-bisphosphate aldolase subunit GatY n=1 Tax=Caproiciproducens galactitolivorans TaxID=642589 RepID=A0A4Z0XVS9_9FIRM|nr:ketose-bisphosphate aldolase [Caproiciproducens galactitolivorans]QEY33758.1 class II fructose-bisphosphate aldolase [Caproiciproducens galactitolivorans]TGJ75454.1 D-tagatose-1,6-bisphosphate aldolase subunit GatY [Caproiciproducens galactitolivorans]
MPLTTSKQMLLDAQKGGYAVGAFNAENMEMVQAIIAAAEELRAPVMIQTTPGTIKYAGVDLYYANVSAAAKNASVPVAIHLDHGNSYELAVQALRAGYTSIMIDGSQEVLEKNIAITKYVVSACAPCGVPVEGELGKVGGKEDDTEGSGVNYTDPEQAVRFVAETGVSSLAVGVGTAHGIYQTKPVLNVELIAELRKVLAVPMVLHGASGLTDKDIRNCVSCGICKVNFATELRIAFSDAVKEYLHQNPAVFDPKKYGAKAREAVKKQVMERMKICGCDGKV